MTAPTASAGLLAQECDWCALRRLADTCDWCEDRHCAVHVRCREEGEW